MLSLPVSHTSAFGVLFADSMVKIEDSVYRSTHADHRRRPCVDAAIKTPHSEEGHCRTRGKQRCKKTHSHLSIQLII